MATSTPIKPTFKPFVPTTETRPELSARALILAGLFRVLFRAVTVYVGLRARLTVDERSPLLYPEAAACPDVLLAGERGGSLAPRVFLGLGLGGVYTLFQNENLFALWPAPPNRNFDLGPQHLLKGAAIRADCTPEYLGVGYIIGIRVAAIMLAGGVFSWLVLMPAIYFFGSHLSTPLYPGTVLITQMSPSDLWRTYVRPMGPAGAAAPAPTPPPPTPPPPLAPPPQPLNPTPPGKPAPPHPPPP